MSSVRRSARIQAGQPASPAIAESKTTSAKPKPKKSPGKPTTTAQPASKKRGRPKSANTAAQLSNNNPSPPPAEPTNTETNVFVTPLTPTNKRRKTAADNASPLKPPPFTPTPSAVGLIASSSPLTNGAVAKPSKPRLAEPHATNAPLSTPGGSRVVAYTSDVPDASEIAPAEEAGVTLKPTTTTENLLEQACSHLIKVDPRLRTVIEKHPCKIFSPEGLQEDVDPFKALVSGILAQQVS
ncbi:dna-3-methyladenine glycosylase [Neofusicoccum parvum]|uniref:Dna-3-methyladenine glycosylase n=1 Tax=Neofusicoccum parvum TaxID=310453 RepID=A0ACB5S5U4_9PEZI|nr:dna-3-methyladenine glycosylase [Neofusicoccum parvum]